MSKIIKRIAELSPEKRRLLLKRLKQKNGDVPRLALRRRARGSGPLLLSFGQQRLWFLDQLEPNSSTWNLSFSYRVKGRVDEEALRYALDQIVQRHEVLRTTFATVPGQPVQVIAEEAKLPLAIVDLRHLPNDDKEIQVERLTREEAAQPFNLARGPLVRCTLLRLGDADPVLLLTMHHIVSDAWTFGLFFEELRAFYAGFHNGRSPSLPELSIQYADYAAWQREWLRGEELERQMSYWREQLAGSPPILRLPTDRPRPNVQTFPGSAEAFDLPMSLSRAIHKLGELHGSTLFMTLLAAFKILLSRYSGQKDILVGCPIAGRNQTELEGLLGFLVNTLVLRTDLGGDPTFSGLLGRVREVTLGAFAHQEMPFEKLVEELQPERDLSTSPMFQVMFVLHNTPTPDFEIEGFTLTPVKKKERPSSFDLTLYMRDQDGKLEGVMEYNTDLFDAATMRRMIGHFEVLLRAIVDNPEQRISSLPLLTGAERHRLLSEANRTATEYPAEKCVHQLFEVRAERTPDAVAVSCGDAQVTFRELNNRVNHLAHYLRKGGVGQDVLVGICLDRSIELVVGLLGILKAGGAYVPLDPSYPRERLDFMLDDSGAAVLLTEQSVIQEAPFTTRDSELRVVVLDRDWEEIALESEQDPESSSLPAGLAYVIYTSGSTGKPKGVAIPHQALVNFLCSMAREPGMTADDALLAVTTLSFDIAGLELYLPLVTGARIVLANREVAADGKQLATLLAESSASIMQATPATWRMLLERDWKPENSLKILCGGEALPRSLADRLLTDGTSLWNMYGPTETTIWSAIERVEEGEAAVALGAPIANTELYVLDRHLAPVPIGVYGELYIGGDGLARGYLNRPELTAEKFVPHQYVDRQGASARLYRTGDLVRYLADGSLEFNGRLDSQVKLRGFRIELGEIEAALAKHPSVAEAVVLVSGEETDKRLLAYVVKSAVPTSVNALRRFLLEALPEYMVPSLFLFLDALPLTPNGKVDRKALPSAEVVRPALEGEYVAPDGETERAIVQVWQKVLQLERVGVEDNFFDLGGHSLLLVQVQNELAARFEREVSMIELFKYPTVKSLARFVGRGEHDSSDLSKIQAQARRQREALSRYKAKPEAVKPIGQ